MAVQKMSRFLSSRGEPVDSMVWIHFEQKKRMYPYETENGYLTTYTFSTVTTHMKDKSKAYYTLDEGRLVSKRKWVSVNDSTEREYVVKDGKYTLFSETSITEYEQ